MNFLDAPPSSEQEWEVLRDPEDIPEAIPEDLLLRRLAPKEFLRRLSEGELVRSAWVQEQPADEESQPVVSPDQSIRHQDRAAKIDARPFGYLLLDASESMGSARDSRNEVARGIALAFLLCQFEAGNPTVVHLFRHELSPMIGGEGRAAFEAAVSAVLAHSHEGMTSLQGALQLLAESMAQDHARVDIALITDGVTRLMKNPLDTEHLHTFLVGVRPEEFDNIGANQYQDSLIQLRDWSDFMFRLDPTLMDQAAVPRREDLLDVAKSLYGFEEEWRSSATTDKVRRLQNRIRNISLLYGRYRKSGAAWDDSLAENLREVEAVLKEHGYSNPVEVAMANASGWTPIDRELSIALETREMRPLAEPPSLGSTWKIQVEMPAYVSPWEAIRKALVQVVAMAKRSLRRAARRIGLKRPQMFVK
jgi:hypothetical protein